MHTTHAPLVTSYVYSMNAQAIESFTALFAPDAVVQDEGQTYQGHTAIGMWITDACQKYQPTLDVTEVVENGNETIVTGMVSGTFDGSPVELHHHLTTAGGKIVGLRITA